MHDGISLERLGVPTAVIVTTVFEHEAHVQRIALGMAAIEPAVIAHPLSTLSDSQIGERAEMAAGQVRKILLGS